MASYLQIFRLKLFYACLVSSIRAVIINEHKHHVKNARYGYSLQFFIISHTSYDVTLTYANFQGHTVALMTTVCLIPSRLSERKATSTCSTLDHNLAVKKAESTPDPDSLETRTRP
jgi:hypothetical protein